MSERLPKTKRILAWIGIVGPLCGAITIAATMVADIRSKLADTTSRTEASYETLAPAVNELQNIVDEFIDEATEEHEHCADLERRLIRVEAYVELVSSRSRFPNPEEVELEAGTSPPPPARAKSRRPQRAVPEQLDRAADYQQKRQKLNCDPKDPLCGVLE